MLIPVSKMMHCRLACKSNYPGYRGGIVLREAVHMDCNHGGIKIRNIIPYVGTLVPSELPKGLTKPCDFPTSSLDILVRKVR